MATIVITPASGAITAKSTVCKVAVTGAAADANYTTSFSTTVYPTSPEERYYMTFTLGGVEYGRTPVFGLTPSGTIWEFDNYVFPASGAWTINLYQSTDGGKNYSSLTTSSVTVS